MHPIPYIILVILKLYIYVLIATAILSWLTSFNIINRSNRLIYLISDFLARITEPLLAPIRRIVPYISGIDLSPMILILILVFLEQAIIYYAL